MGDAEPRYSFDPLERRGVLLGLQPAQLLTVAIAAVVALLAGRSLGRLGLPVALVVLVAGVGSAIWSREGRPASMWLLDAAAWSARRARGPSLDNRPLMGNPIGVTVNPAHETLRRPRSDPAIGTAPRGVELAELTAGQDAIGIAIDRRHRRWVAIVQVAGASFALLDPADQARRLEGWRVVLNSLGRPGTDVRRIQWIERSFPDASVTDWADPGLPGTGPVNPAVDSYRALVTGADPAQRHESWLALSVEGPASTRSSNAGRAEQVLRRELRLLEGQLRNAELQPSSPLDRRTLVATIASVFEAPPAPRQAPAGSRSSPWPAAQAEQWSYLRSGAAWHATYWIADWPRIDVSPNFLMPLLMTGGRRTVSLIMEPVSPSRAAREVRSARTADAADEQLRSRAGFLPSARRNREAEGVIRREAELADGHADFRYSGYVAVHAADRSSLDVACAEAEHAAQASQLELVRLYGRQGEAFTWTLPLGRGLR